LRHPCSKETNRTSPSLLRRPVVVAGSRPVVAAADEALDLSEGYTDRGDGSGFQIVVLALERGNEAVGETGCHACPREVRVHELEFASKEGRALRRVVLLRLRAVDAEALRLVAE
jgi:hypothetical protein